MMCICCFSDRTACVLSDYKIHDETVYNLQFSSFSGLSLVHVLSDFVIRAFTYWSDQISSFFFFIQECRSVKLCMVQFSAVNVGAGQA